MDGDAVGRLLSAWTEALSQMRRKLTKASLHPLVVLRISFGWRQPLPVEAGIGFRVPHFLLVSRLQKLLHLLHRGREVMQRKQALQRVNGLVHQMQGIMREDVDQARCVNLRVAGRDRRIKADQPYRRFFRREQIV